MTWLELLLAGLMAALCLLAGLLLRPKRREPDVSALRDSLSRTEGKIQTFAESLEHRWKAFDEAADRKTSETNWTLAGLREKIGEISEAHRRLEKLDSHVVDLQNLLANKQAAGAFGEVQLENLVRQSLPPKAYEFQKMLSNRTRIDCLVTLPHPPGPIAIDSKFPIASYRVFSIHAAGPANGRHARIWKAP